MEEAFPRGKPGSGGRFQRPKTVKPIKRKAVDKIDDLFKPAHGSNKRPTPTKDNKAKSVAADGAKEASEAPEALKLSSKSEFTCNVLQLSDLTPGMLVLGTVCEIFDYRLAMSLPGNIRGFVSISEISESYTNELKRFADAGNAATGAPPTLQSIFKLGQLIPCKVIDRSTKEVTVKARATKKQKSKKGKQDAPVITKDILELSINPRVVNSDLSEASLVKGMLISGAISSVEEKGYVVDLGLPSTSKAFVKSKDTVEFEQQYNSGNRLSAHQILPFIVSEIRSGFVSLKLNPAMKKTEFESLPMRCIFPGMVLSFDVLEVRRNGIILQRSSGDDSSLPITAAAHWRHLPASPDSYKVGTNVSTTVLYIDPLTKTVSVSLFRHLRQVIHGSDSAGAVGRFFEKAKVVRVDGKRGVVFEVANNSEDTNEAPLIFNRAFAKISHLADEKIPKIDENKFATGSTHRCRVIALSYIDGCYVVSLRKSILSNTFQSFETVTPGTKVNVTVEETQASGLRVSLDQSKFISGFIPWTHANAASSKSSLSSMEAIEKRFAVGTKLKCRVLSVDADRKRMILTAKKQLVKAKNESLFTDLSSIVPDSCCDGYVIKVQEAGILVGFYNKVVGFLPRSLMPPYYRSTGDLRTVFHNGQVISCKAKNISMEKNSLILSMVVPDDQILPEEGTVKPEADGPSQFKNDAKASPVDVGQIVSCKVVSKRDDGFHVLVRLPGCTGEDDFKISATLPSAHLSDFVDNQQLLANTIKPDCVLDKVVVLRHRPRLAVSRKPSLIEAAELGGSSSRFAKSFDDVQPGVIFHGWVVSVSDFGIHVALPGSVVGLVPKKFIADRFVVNPMQLYKPGQSVVVKVIESNSEKDDRGRRRCIFSLRLRDVRLKTQQPSDCDYSSEHGFRLLENFLNERQQFGENSLQKAAPIGSVVSAVVTSVNNDDVTCSVGVGDQKLTAKIPKEQMAPSFRHSSSTIQNPSVGTHLDVLVLYHDLVNQCLEVTANTGLISDVKTKLESPALPTLPGQVIPSEVELVRSGMCAVVALREHATGKLALVPARRHLNDSADSLQFIQGQNNPVVIKETSFSSNIGLPIGVFKIHDRQQKFGDPTAVALESPTKVSVGLLPSGSIVTGVVVNFTPTILNVQMEDGKFRGRVHISETPADHVLGYQPFSGMVKGQQVKVRVLGLRNRTTQSKYTARGRVFECSLLLEKPNPRSHPLLSEADVLEGLSTPIFVRDYRHQYAIVEFSRMISRLARINLLNISSSTTTIDEVPSLYPPGTCLGSALVIRTSPFIEFSLVGRPVPVEVGRVFTGLVTGKSNAGGIEVAFADGSTGRVALTDISDEFGSFPVKSVPQNKTASCFVIERFTDATWGLSMRQSRVIKSEEQHHGSTIVDREIKTAADLLIGDVVRGFVVACKEHGGVFVRIGRNVVGRASFEKSSEYFLVTPEKFFKSGLLVSAKVTNVDSHDLSRPTVELSLLPTDTGVTLDIPKALTRGKRKELFNASGDRKRTRTTSTSSVQSSEASAVKKTTLAKVAVDAENVVPAESAPKFDFSQSEIVQPPLISSVSSAHQEDATTDEASSVNRKETARERESRTYALEMTRLRAIDDPSAAEPKSSDDFDRLVIEKPNSSLVWTRYIAFHLANLDVARAREVAERALKSVSFREETERLNVWVAYFHLENLFGSDETLRDTVRRACQEADALLVYERLVEVYVKAEKFDAAEHQLSMLTKKFRENPAVWLRQGEFYFNQGKLDAARATLNKALDALEMRNHVDLIIKFASMEMSGSGDFERGRSLFEKLLSSYPRRLDIWNVYADALVKKGNDIAGARRLYERLVMSRLPYNKARLVFRRFATFERTHGDEESMANVEELAKKYLEQSSAEEGVDGEDNDDEDKSGDAAAREGMKASSSAAGGHRQHKNSNKKQQMKAH